MITGFFLSLLLTVATFIVGLLPTYAFPTAISNAITTFWSYVNLFSLVIPVGTIAVCIGIMTLFYGVEFLWQAAHWVLRRFRR